MDNGVGVVEEIHVGEVKASDDEMTEMKFEEMVDAIGFHARKESEGDEVFEEAIEPVLNDGFDNTDDSKPDSDVAVSSSKIDIGDGDTGFYAAEENSSLGDEGKAVEGSDEERKGDGESKEKSEVSLAADNDEGSVTMTCLNDNDDLTNEGLPLVHERSLDLEDGHANISSDVEVEKSSSEGLQVESTTVEEAGTVVPDEDVIEKLVVVDNSQNRDAEDIGEDEAGAHSDKDADKDADNETKREVGDASVGAPYDAQMEKLEESKVVAAILNGHISTEVEDVSASTNSENQAKNGVPAENPSGDIDSETQIVSMVSEDQEHHDTDTKVEESPATSAPVDSTAAMTSETEVSTPPASSVDKDMKSEKVAPEKVNANDRLLSSDVTAGSNRAHPEGRAIEEIKTEETQNSGATGKTAIKAAQISVSSSGKSANPSGPPARPAGLGRAAPLLEPAPRAVHQPRANGQVSQVQSSLVEDTTNAEVEEGDEVREKLQMIRVKFLRLAHRLGQTPHNVVVAQVLYRLGLAEQLRARNGGRVGAFSFDRASAMAEQLEATGREPLDFSCTIMVLGKTGVGKSATINSIFDEVKFSTDAFQMGTKKVQDVVGTVQGIKVRVIDTPGLLPSCVDQRQNERILHSVKRFIKKSPPDIVLYLDRLDMPSRDFGDMPLLRTITDIFGPSIWFNAIVVLTHAASAPPEGPNGTASTYDMFVTQRSHAVQQAIRQAAGDMRLMNPVSLVENHSACRTNRAGQRVLPNGQVWKPHLLLLSFASKILAEANTLLKLQDTPPGKPFTTRPRAPSLPLLLSSLLQSRPQLKLPEEQFADDDNMDDDLDESSDSDDESEYDDLPPFRPLAKDQLAKLSRAQKKAYYDELEYREKLFMKKQLKEERRRRKMMKKMEAAAKDIPGDYGENVGGESDGAASLPVPMPDLPLPASFDSDNPTHRYRCLDSSNQWLVRPNLDTHGWDHDVGYEGVNVERMFVVKDKIPVSFSGQISKDKKEANVQMELASSMKHGEGKATTMGFDMQSVGKDMAYTLRSETRFSNYRHNKATAGLSATVLGDALSAGVKLEDKLIVNKQFRMVMSGGAMAGRGDVAYGGSLEATFRDKDYPVGRFLSTLGLSVMDWHGELALGGNIQTQIPVGRLTTLVARANLNNRGSGQVSLRVNSSEQLQLALIGLIPLLRKLIGQYQEHPFGH